MYHISMRDNTYIERVVYFCVVSWVMKERYSICKVYKRVLETKNQLIIVSMHPPIVMVFKDSILSFYLRYMDKAQ